MSNIFVPKKDLMEGLHGVLSFFFWLEISELIFEMVEVAAEKKDVMLWFDEPPPVTNFPAEMLMLRRAGLHSSFSLAVLSLVRIPMTTANTLLVV